MRGDDLAAERDADFMQCAPKACPCGFLVGFGPQECGGDLARHGPAGLGEVDEERGRLAQGELHPPPVQTELRKAQKSELQSLHRSVCGRAGTLRGRRPSIYPHDVGPIGPDQKTPLEREMSLVNTLTHHCTSEAVAEDGVPIAYEDLGRGEPLVLLHGVTENSECWHEAGYVEQLLRRGRRLILIDCRGHGRSGKPHDPAAYSGRRRAADVIAVLDCAGLQHAALMGHSMGGVVALAAALYHPDRVSALVVNGAHPYRGGSHLLPSRAQE